MRRCISPTAWPWTMSSTAQAMTGSSTVAPGNPGAPACDRLKAFSVRVEGDDVLIVLNG